jgi:hypothetical protein
VFQYGQETLWIFGGTKEKYRLCVTYLKNGALLEYTLFSHQHLKTKE